MSDVVSRFEYADDRKNDSISKLKSRQAQHIEKVNLKLEESFIREEERKDQAMYRTEDQRLNFLQRLETQNKDK